jgi:hypothetical protein
MANALIEAGKRTKSRHGTRILDNIGSIVPCPFIDPKPVTSPRKPIHGLRDCALLNFRVARYPGVSAIGFTQADFSFSIGFGECIGDLAPMQNRQLSSSELTYF